MNNKTIKLLEKLQIILTIIVIIAILTSTAVSIISGKPGEAIWPLLTAMWATLYLSNISDDE